MSVTIAIGVAVFTAAYLSSGELWAGTPRTRNLGELVRALDGAGPLTTRKVAVLLGPLRCGWNSFCDGEPVRVRDAVIGKVDFRPHDGGALLILDQIGGSCVPAQAVVPPGASRSRIVNGCTDGVTCLYREVDRPWGKLSMGVGDAGPSACVRSVVIEQRN